MPRYRGYVVVHGSPCFGSGMGASTFTEIWNTSNQNASVHCQSGLTNYLR